jgi:uncharacterized protein
MTLRAPAHLVSSRARWYWAVRAGAGWLAVVAVEALIWLAAPGSGAVHLGVLLATLLLAAAHLAVMPQWRYRVHRWETTETAVYTQTGWFTQERRIAPMARIQTVDTRRGPVEQLFRLTNVTVTTASAKGPLKIHALDLEVADHIVEHLTRRAQLSAEDGT